MVGRSGFGRFGEALRISRLRAFAYPPCTLCVSILGNVTQSGARETDLHTTAEPNTRSGRRGRLMPGSRSMMTSCCASASHEGQTSSTRSTRHQIPALSDQAWAPARGRDIASSWQASGPQWLEHHRAVRGFPDMVRVVVQHRPNPGGGVATHSRDTVLGASCSISGCLETSGEGKDRGDICGHCGLVHSLWCDGY